MVPPAGPHQLWGGKVPMGNPSSRQGGSRNSFCWTDLSFEVCPFCGLELVKLVLCYLGWGPGRCCPGHPLQPAPLPSAY